MIELIISILIALLNPSAPANTATTSSTQTEQTSSSETITAFGGTGTWIDKEK